MKIFLDTSDINEIRALKDKVDGFTTNPTLMRKEGVVDYEKFCKEVLAEVGDKPVSFEVFADDFDEMERQARTISGWGENVYVKIPITNTRGESSIELVEGLQRDGIKVNITAVFTYDQLVGLSDSVTPRIVSIFAGRIADTGIEPQMFRYGLAEILWASPREVLNIYQAEQAGADIITITPELFRKYEKMKGYDLNQLSLDTVKMFYQDAKESGFKL